MRRVGGRLKRGSGWVGEEGLGFSSVGIEFSDVMGMYVKGLESFLD